MYVGLKTITCSVFPTFSGKEGKLECNIYNNTMDRLKRMRNIQIGNLIFSKALIIWLSNLSILSVPHESYSRNVSCALILISTFLLHGYVRQRSP